LGFFIKALEGFPSAFLRTSALPLSMKRNEIILLIKRTLRASGVKKAYLYGSFARNEKKYHDIDIAIVPPAGKFSLMDLVGLELELSKRVKKKVDLVTLKSISPYIMPYVKKELVAI